jgi:hypothetical protein
VFHQAGPDICPSHFSKGKKQTTSKDQQGREWLPKLLYSFFPLSKLLQNVRGISYFSCEAIPESGQDVFNSVTSAFQEAH